MEGIISKNQEAQDLITKIVAKINLLKKGGVNTEAYDAENNELIVANNALRAKIEQAKKDLKSVEIACGKKQISVPEQKKVDVIKTDVKPEAEKPNVETPKAEEKPSKKEVKKETKPKAEKKPEAGDSDVVDASKLDMRIGRILEVSRHADADSLFVETVDVGEDKPRQIISGLVKYCNEADLKGRLGVFLLNLKPAKMRGVMSEGMIMCASAPQQGKVEPLTVPADSKPGDRVTVEGYEGKPDDVLNPKKKTFELIKPDLRVNGDGIATYKGARWILNGKVGAVVAASLTEVAIA